MTQLSNGRTAAKALFEAGDRPTDQNFTNVFDSILFLGESNPNTLTLTSLAGNFSVGGSLSSGGTFTVNNLVMFGSATENLNLPLQVYGDEDETIIFASGSLSNILFEGISGDATSSIKLQDSSTYARFGTHTNKGFLEIHGEEIITYSTGSSAGDNIVYMSGSVGIGITTPITPLHIHKPGTGAGDHSYIQLTTGDTGTTISDGMTIGFTAAQQGIINVRENQPLELSTNNTTRLTIEAGGDVIIEENVGIGTSAPGDKLSVVGNIAIRNAGNSLDVMKFSNANSVASTPDIQFNGAAQLSAQDDFNINIDSDGSGTTAKFSIKKDTDDTGGTEIFKVTEAGEVSGSSFIGDGSGLTNLTAASITNLLSAGSDNRVVTSTGANSIQGEVNLTFDGSKLGINTTPHQELHVKGNIMMGDNGGSGNFIHGRDHLGISADGTVFISSDANDISGTGVSDIIFGYGSAVDLNSSPTSTYADSFPSSKPRVELMRLNSSNGRVGIGITAPNEKLTVGGSILASGSGYMTMGVNQTDSGQVRMGITSGTSRAHLLITSNRSNYPEYLTVQGTNNVMMTVSQSRLDVWDSVGAQGIVLQSLASTNGWGGGQFSGDSDVKVNQIYFTDHAGSSDNGWIRHETSGTTGETNKSQLHIAPSDDNTAGDLISFGSSNTGHANSHKFYTSGLTYVGGYLGINQTSPQNMLHVRVNTVSVGTSHDNDIGILIEQSGTGDAGVEFEAGGQYFSIFLDQSQDDLLIRDISNSRTLAQFTDDGNVILGHSGHVYGRSQNAASTKLYRFGGLYLTWDSDSYGTNYNHSITSTHGSESSFGAHMTLNSYGSILMNIDSNDNESATFRIGHKTTANDNILFEMDETGLITTTNTIKMADSDNYWLATGTSTNWGLYWKTTGTNNTLEWHGGGTEVGYIDLDNGNAVHRGWVYGDYFRATEAPGSAAAGEVRIGVDGSGNNAGQMKLQTEHGYVKTGPANPSHSHFYTDRASYYFNKKLIVDENEVRSYDGSLVLRHKGDADYISIQSDRIQLVVSGEERWRVQGNVVYLNEKVAFESGDAWLRINDGSTFSSGIYTGTSLIRSDNALQLGASGNEFHAYDGKVAINRSDGAVASTTYQTMVMKMKGAKAGFAIENDSNTDYWNCWYGHGSSDVTFGSSANQLIWSHNGAGQNGGWIQKTTNGVNQMFTGQHRNIPAVGEVTDYMTKIGYIVSSNGTIQNVPGDETVNHEVNRPNINESLPRVKLSNTANDKKVYGVISELEDPESTGRTFMNGNFGSIMEKAEGDSRLIINSLGEGAIMVCNINGNLENGDYITTSTVEGIGMKQDDDLLHNYTVAKIIQDCNFTNNQQYMIGSITHNGVTYSTALVGCTYHCG
jgi:hypothetical protein